jgi:hypothetical protein
MIGCGTGASNQMKLFTDVMHQPSESSLSGQVMHGWAWMATLHRSATSGSYALFKAAASEEDCFEKSARLRFADKPVTCPACSEIRRFRPAVERRAY